MENKDLYSILGVSKNATYAELKSAYRKLSMKYHPDCQTGKSEVEKKAAEEKFKAINAAYSVLGDKNKRANYDQFGSTGCQHKFSGFNNNGFDSFSHFHKTTDFNNNHSNASSFNVYNRRRKTAEELFCIGLMIGLCISTSLLLFFKDDITRFITSNRDRHEWTSR